MFFKKFFILIAFFGLFLAACDGPEQKGEKYLERGDVFFAQKKYAKARIEYRNAGKIFPTSPIVLYKLGLVEEAEGNIKKAFEAFMVAEQQDQNFEPAVTKLAQYFMMAEQYEQVSSRVERLLSINPQSADARALYSSILLKQGYLTEAEKEAKTALELDSGNIVAFSVLTGYFLAKDQQEKAIENLEEGIRRNPGDLSLLLLKAAVHSQIEEIGEVAKVYESIFELRADEIRFRFDLAEIFSRTGHIAEAEATLRSAAALFPANLEARRRLYGFLEEQRGVAAAEEEIRKDASTMPDKKMLRLWLADLYVRHGLDDRAVSTLEELLNAKADEGISLNARTSLAGIQLSKGDAAMAARLVEEVLARNVNYPDALYVRASLAFSQGDYQKAVADLRTIVRDNPRSTKALKVLAETLLLQGHRDLAVDTLTQSLALDPADLRTHVRLAQIHATRGNLDQARELLRAVTSADPSYAIGWESAARLAIETSRWDEAAVLVEKLEDMDGQKNLAAFLRGQIKAGTGNSREAIAIYRQVVESASPSPLADHAVAAMLALYDDPGNRQELIDYLSSIKDGGPTVTTILGGLLIDAGDFGKAEEILIASINNNPFNQAPFLLYAGILDQRGEIEKTLAILERAENTVPGDISAPMKRAGILLSKNRVSEALDIYERLAVRNPEIDAVANNLAQTIADHKSHDREAMERARIMAERFAKSDNPFYLDTLGWVYLRQGNLLQATSVIERAISLTGASPPPQMQYHYGVLLMETGRMQEARDMLAKAAASQESWPGIEDAKARLKKLR